MPPTAEEIEQLKDEAEQLEIYTREELDRIFGFEEMHDYSRSLLELVYDEIYPLLERAGLRTGSKGFLDVNRRSLPPIAVVLSMLFYDGNIKPDEALLHHPLNRECLHVVDTKGKVPEEPAGIGLQGGTSKRNYGEIALMLQEVDTILAKKRDKYAVSFDSAHKFRGRGKDGYVYDPADILLLSPYKAQLSCIKDTVPAWVAWNRLCWLITKNDPQNHVEEISQLWDSVGTYCGEHWSDQRIGFPGKSSKQVTLADVCQKMRSVDGVSNRTYRRRFGLIGTCMQKRLPIAACARVYQESRISDVFVSKIEREMNLLEEGLNTSTVDSIQGDEAPVAVVSLVRSNVRNTIGFLNNLHRLCVALSRGQEYLGVIGDISGTLSQATCHVPQGLSGDQFLRKQHEAQQTEEARRVFEALGVYGRLYDRYVRDRDMRVNELEFLANRFVLPIAEGLIELEVAQRFFSGTLWEQPVSQCEFDMEQLIYRFAQDWHFMGKETQVYELLCRARESSQTWEEFVRELRKVIGDIVCVVPGQAPSPTSYVRFVDVLSLSLQNVMGGGSSRGTACRAPTGDNVVVLAKPEVLERAC